MGKSAESGGIHALGERGYGDKLIANQSFSQPWILCQLNRQIETRVDKKPKLSDLRESGAIEQDADVVAFLHRPEVYDPTDRPGECDLLIEKNRRGPTGRITLSWRAETTQFDDGAQNFGPRDL